MGAQRVSSLVQAHIRVLTGLSWDLYSPTRGRTEDEGLRNRGPKPPRLIPSTNGQSVLALRLFDLLDALD
jgi:hypothetical protein